MIDDFETEIRWAGWRALAAAAFNLRPNEAHALTLMRRRAGAAVTFAAFAGFIGQAAKSHGEAGTTGAIRKRVERVRAKIEDIGCAGIIETVRDGPFSPARGYRMSREGAGRIDEAVRCACGLEPRMAA